MSLRGAQRATWQSPGRETSETNPRQPKCPRWRTAEKSPAEETGHSRTRYAAGRGRPALPTASPRIVPPVISSVSREIPYGKNGNNHTPITPNTRPRWRTADGKLCVRGIDTQRALWYNNPVNTFAPLRGKRAIGFVIASRQMGKRLYNRAASERNGFVIASRQTVERLYNRVENDVPYTRFFDGTRKIY